MADTKPLVTTGDVTWVVDPAAPPELANRLNGPLRVVGCAGEYEPVAFTLYVDTVAPAVTVAVTGFDGWQCELFWVQPVTAVVPAEPATTPELPAPDAEPEGQVVPPAPPARSSPAVLLRPCAEDAPALAPGLGQRVVLDCRIPATQPPGTTRGSVELRSGERLLVALPLEVTVLPFALAKAPSDYWLWRLTWSPIDLPGNLACLRDIAAHGFTGLTRKCGASFTVGFEADGAIRVRPGTMPALAQALRETGLTPSFADDGVGTQILTAIAHQLKLPVSRVGEELPTLERSLFVKLKREHGEREARRRLEAPADPAPELDLAEPVATDPDAALRAEAARQASALQARIRPLAVDGLRQAKAIADDLGLALRVFPVDEPCGTPWRRRWTTYLGGLAREAGLPTWSTRNNWDWEANLDEGAAGGMIDAMYRLPALAEAAYEGELAFPARPWIGGFRDGAAYHFAGLIDEVRIYDRALTAEEILRQHEQPAADPALYLPCDGPDAAARLIGKPRFVPGRVGQAVQLDGVAQHLVPLAKPPADPRQGWSISLWYRGSGCLFGQGYAFYHQGGLVRYTTTAQDKAWFRFGGHQSERFWCHLTLSFDPATRTVRAYCEDSELRRWHREQVRWNYLQVRAAAPEWARYELGVMAWWYASHGALSQITAFCYDLNLNTCLVYPQGGDRNSGVWYRTLGWEACREGIDDARYLQTLVQAFEAKRGLTRDQAVRQVEALLAPVDGSYAGQQQLVATFGSCHALRQRVIEELLKLP